MLQAKKTLETFAQRSDKSAIDALRTIGPIDINRVRTQGIELRPSGVTIKPGTGATVTPSTGSTIKP